MASKTPALNSTSTSAAPAPIISDLDRPESSLQSCSESAMASPSTDTTKRTSLACNHCRLKRQKCDGNKSGCSQCAALRVFCTFPDAKKRGPVKGYIDILESRLHELESALLQVLPLVSNEQLNEITASIPPIPSRPHFRARFSKSSDGSPPQNPVVSSTAPPPEIVFRQVQQHEKSRQQRQQQQQQQQSQTVAKGNNDLRPCSLQHSHQQYPNQMMSGSWQQQQQQQQHLPLELSPFDGSWPLVGNSITRQDQCLVSPTRHNFGVGAGSEFDFLPDFDRNGGRETVMVSSRGF